jgi:hypothetical protein
MMKRERAIRIEQCLVDADRAMHRARLIIASLAKEDRIRFGDLLDNVVDALHSEVLAAIYDQHPDLEPPQVDREVPIIDSDLQWGQVSLPPSVTVLDFDRVILSELSPHWRKTARIVGRVSEQYIELDVDMDPAIVAARLMAMVQSDLVEGAGDLRLWRFSEVRLKP